MKSLMMTVVAALCCVAFADEPEAGAAREGGRRGPGMREGGMGAMMGDPIVRMVTNPRVAEQIGLSEEQKAKIKELGGAGEAGREKQQKVREATRKQFELMNAEKVDEAAVMKAIDEVFELRKEIAKDQAKRTIAIKSVLTPEQASKAREEMRKMFESFGERGPRADGERGPRRGGNRGNRGNRQRGGDRPAEAK